MKEVKPSKKPLIFYYSIVLIVLLLVNIFITPMLSKYGMEEVGYERFMTMTKEKNIGKVQVNDSEIIFTDKNDEKVYKTGIMDDPGLTERLYE